MASDLMLSGPPPIKSSPLYTLHSYLNPQTDILHNSNTILISCNKLSDKINNLKAMQIVNNSLDWLSLFLLWKKGKPLNKHQPVYIVIHLSSLQA